MSLFVEDEKVDTQSTHSLWVEKYRPKVLGEYVGSEALKTSLEGYIKNNDIPHILLHSQSPGTGKTTAAKMIANSIDSDVLYINASDSRKVEELTSQIKTFVSCVGFKKWKVVVLDEVDFISPTAQALLRNLLEAYSHNTRFILTCNYVQRVMSPVVSRCQVFEVIPPSKKDIAVHLTKILTKENVTYDAESIKFIVNTYYPDIRKIINFSQQSAVDGTLNINQKAIIEGDLRLKIIELLKSSVNKKDSFTKIRQVLADNKMSDYTELFSALYQHVDDYAKGNVANTIIAISDSQSQSALVADREITFMACIIKLLKIIHKEE
jgi:replication factor C small subunit